jgi:uncharacterized membrane protein YkoI
MRVAWNKTFITVTGLTLLGYAWGVRYITASDLDTSPLPSNARITSALATSDAPVARLAAFYDDDDYVTARITTQQAMDAALQARPGVVTEVDLESEYGRPVYEIRITASDGRRYEVDVDSDTAQVLQVIYKGGGTPRTTAQQAVDAALLAQPGVATELELGKEYNRPVYEVNVTANDGRRYEVMVDGDTAQVLLALPKIGLERIIFARVTLSQAMDAALRAQAGTVTRADLDSDHGRPVYEVSITASTGWKYEVNVDGNTAQILRVKLDD